MAPLERVKLLHQAGVRETSVWDTMVRVKNVEGFKGLWKGNLSSCYRVFPNKGIMFTMNDCLKSKYIVAKTGNESYYVVSSVFRGLPSWSIPMLSGALSGAVADALTYPLDLSRTRQSCTIGATRFHLFL